MCSFIADQRIDENRGYFLLGKASIQRQLYDFRSITSAKIGFLANPDIDRAQVTLDVPQ
tara:strand:- start:247 stop:423 length:177 start_codon:yes stop_codon:yes gene_type:complete